MAAADKFPLAQLVGVDIDPLATLMLRANAAVRGFASRLIVHLTDYRKLELAPIAGASAAGTPALQVLPRGAWDGDTGDGRRPRYCAQG